MPKFIEALLDLDPVIHDVMIDAKDLFRVSQELLVGKRVLAYASMN